MLDRGGVKGLNASLSPIVATVIIGVFFDFLPKYLRVNSMLFGDDFSVFFFDALRLPPLQSPTFACTTPRFVHCLFSMTVGTFPLLQWHFPFHDWPLVWWFCRRFNIHQWLFTYNWWYIWRTETVVNDDF